MQRNKYIKNAKISEVKFRQLLKIYSIDESASKAALIVGVHINTAERIFKLLRQRVAFVALQETEKELSGEFEVDESYFGAKRIRGKRGRGAAGKTPVFGLLKRNGKVYTQIIKKCSKQEIMPIIQGKILESSTIYSDGWKAYDGLVLNGYEHYRIYHSHDEFARGKNHVNGIESFWSFTKRRLNKFNGFTKSNFSIFLKESEFRFNHRHDNIYMLLLSHIRKFPL
jgi:transposase-like protein